MQKFKKLINSKTGKKLRKTMFAQWVKNSFFYKTYLQSSGDFRYPFYLIAWGIANILTMRKTVSVGDVVYTLPNTNWITHFRWFRIKKKEPEVRYFIDQYVKENDIFFDIGANIGVFSLYAGKKYENLRIYCFEPEYSNLYLLKENILKNSLTKKILIYSVGVSDFTGLSSLHLQDLKEGSAAHTENPGKIKETDEGFKVIWSEGIATFTLDQLCESLNVCPNTIKIDTDGNEFKILNGAVKTLKNPDLRSLIIEMPRSKEFSSQCEEILKKNNFFCCWSKKGVQNEIWEKI